MIEHKLLENPKPWMNDAAVEYYESLLKPKMRILEFGSGYSTIWLENFEPTYLVSYEDDEEWANALQPYLELCEITRINDYPMSLMNVWKPQTFDLIIIDGINRLKCLYWVLEHDLLAEGGTIVYDDMHRRWSVEEYQDAWETLEDENMELIMQPNTTIKHRVENIFDGEIEDKDITLFAHKKR
jgi:predicted O-methyltransferase YrrM